MIPLYGGLGSGKAFFGTSGKSLISKLQKKGKQLNRNIKGTNWLYNITSQGIQNMLQQNAQKLSKL